MEKARLTDKLASGRSIESIAREVGRDPSTVADWVGKHGLASVHAAKHAARGGIERAELAALVDEGLSVRAIAARLGVSYATVRYAVAGRGSRASPECVLLGANCHAEVEAGVAGVPLVPTMERERPFGVVHRRSGVAQLAVASDC